jgi:Zn-dependent protease with chaperone function
MKQVPDRKKLRREYLGKMCAIMTTRVILNLLFIFTLLATAVLGYCSVSLLVNGQLQNPFSTERPYSDPLSVCVLFMFCLPFTVFAGMLAWMFWLGLKEAQTMATALTLVPPLTPNTLPADEILGRASEKPPITQSEILLRPAQAQETPQQELLRVSKGNQQ